MCPQRINSSKASEFDANVVHESTQEGEKNVFKTIEFGARLFDTKTGTKDLEALLANVGKLVDLKTPTGLKAMGEARRIEVKLSLDTDTLASMGPQQRREVIAAGAAAGLPSEALAMLEDTLSSATPGEKALLFQGLVRDHGLDGLACVVRGFPEVERTMTADISGYEGTLRDAENAIAPFDLTPVNHRQGRVLFNRIRSFGKHLERLTSERQVVKHDPLIEDEVRDGLMERYDRLVKVLNAGLSMTHLSKDEQYKMAMTMHSVGG